MSPVYVAPKFFNYAIFNNSPAAFVFAITPAEQSA